MPEDTSPLPQHDQPTPQPTMPAGAHLSMQSIRIALAFTIGILVGVGGLLGYQTYVTASQITTYEACILARGSRIQETFPPTCVTRNGTHFVQRLPDSGNPVPTQEATPTPACRPRPPCLDQTPRCMIPETEDMCPPAPAAYSCPETEWVDCMPVARSLGGKDASIFCSSGYLTWAKDHCPNFKGAAY